MAEATPLNRSETMYAASFEVRHDCVVGSESERLPDTRILHWCLGSRDIFQISGPEDQIGSFERFVDDLYGIKHRSTFSGSTFLVTRDCSCIRPKIAGILSLVGELGAWDIPPIVYRDGWESWRVIAWDEATVKKLFRELRSLGELRLTSLHPIENPRMERLMLMPASDIFADVTDRQLTALILGLESGYYSVPSETSVDRLAHAAGVATSTISEHLRKAETRILRNLLPYVQAYAGRLPGEVAVGELRSHQIPIAR